MLDICNENGKNLLEQVEALKQAVDAAKEIEGVYEISKYYKDEVLTKMNELRNTVDTLESITPSKYWPYPSYGEILYSVN